jgi:hypothetical protein
MLANATEDSTSNQWFDNEPDSMDDNADSKEMNRMPENALVVLDIAGTCARVLNSRADNFAALLRLGFVRPDNQDERRISGMNDRIALVEELIALEALFTCGRDWSPAEVVAFFQEQGWVKTACRTIAWADQDTYLVGAVQAGCHR